MHADAAGMLISPNLVANSLYVITYDQDSSKSVRAVAIWQIY
jgi:hypothetical protein